jgi:hypothetical protein
LTKDKLSQNPQERSQVFTKEFLELICETFELFGAAFTFECIPDDRAFISTLTKELISGIRKVPEHTSKSESSQGKLVVLVLLG